MLKIEVRNYLNSNNEYGINIILNLLTKELITAESERDYEYVKNVQDLINKLT